MNREVFQVQLKEEVSVGEAVTGISALAVALSVLYNLGFFNRINSSIVSLLSVQDVLIGAAIALVPSAGIIIFGASLLSSAYDGSRVAMYILFTLFFIFAASMIGIAILFRNSTYVVVFNSISFSIFSLIGAHYVFGNFNNLLNRFNVANLVFISAFNIGVAHYAFLVAYPKSPNVNISLQDENVNGNIIRITSQYTFIYVDNNMQIIRNSEIKKMEVTEAGY